MLIKSITLILAGLIAYSPLVFADSSEDPYSAVEYQKLANGVQVFFAPSETATTTEIQIQVATGTDAESDQNRGVSHLLEHVLFRDKGLKDEMTYLQLIKEAGGSANGGTGERATTYYGSIPPVKASWLFESMTKMLLEPSFNDKYVEKEKGTVELERGRPGPITLALGFNPTDYLHPRYLQAPDFWESEFNYQPLNTYTISEEQLSTRRLTTKQVQTHYEDFYVPANMKIFIAGKFDHEEMRQILDLKWAALPPRTGKTLPPKNKIDPRMSPYIRMHVSEENPNISLGTKLWDVSIKNEMVIKSYMEYLAHRLMKEIRNLKGQTYTAHASSFIERHYGYSTISFETPKENLEENLSIAKTYLQKQAQEGGLSANEVKEAIDLFQAQYKLRGKESHSMMSLARQYSEVVEENGSFISPYAVLEDMKPDDYNHALKESFRAERAYETQSRPSLLFQYDYILITALFAVGLFLLLRRVLTKPFAHDQIRWVRKTRFPPLKSLETLSLLVALYASGFVYAFSQHALIQSNWFQSSMLASHYLNSCWWVFCLIAAAQGVLCLLPRKLIIMQDKLMIKSATYHSQVYSLDQIEAVETLRPLKVLFSNRIWKVKHRWAYFHALFWKKGLFLRMKNGKTFYFGLSAPEAAEKELNRFLKQTRETASGAAVTKIAFPLTPEKENDKKAG